MEALKAIAKELQTKYLSESNKSGAPEKHLPVVTVANNTVEVKIPHGTVLIVYQSSCFLLSFVANDDDSFLCIITIFHFDLLIQRNFLFLLSFELLSLFRSMFV